MTKIVAQKRFELGRLEARLSQTDFDTAWRNKVRGADDKQDLILDTPDREFNIHLFYITNKIIQIFLVNRTGYFTIKLWQKKSSSSKLDSVCFHFVI